MALYMQKNEKHAKHELLRSNNQELCHLFIYSAKSPNITYSNDLSKN